MVVVLIVACTGYVCLCYVGVCLRLQCYVGDVVFYKYYAGDVMLVCIQLCWCLVLRQHINTTKVAEDVLKTLVPPSGEHLDLASVRDKLLAVRRSARVLASSTTVQDEVQGIIGHMSNLAESRPPADKDMARFSTLTKQVLKAAEDGFVYTSMPDVVTVGKKKTIVGPAVEYRGAEGIGKLYDQVAKDFADNGLDGYTLNHIKPLRQFRWVLLEAQKLQVLEWIKKITALSSTGSVSMKSRVLALADEGAGGAADSALVAVSSSSTSSSSHAAPAAALPPLTKSAQQKRLKEETHQDALLKFFTKKPKVS
jgi:hypothetical protein